MSPTPSHVPITHVDSPTQPLTRLFLARSVLRGRSHCATLTPPRGCLFFALPGACRTDHPRRRRTLTQTMMMMLMMTTTATSKRSEKRNAPPRPPENQHPPEKRHERPRPKHPTVPLRAVATGSAHVKARRLVTPLRVPSRRRMRPWAPRLLRREERAQEAMEGGVLLLLGQAGRGGGRLRR